MKLSRIFIFLFLASCGNDKSSNFSKQENIKSKGAASSHESNKIIPILGTPLNSKNNDSSWVILKDSKDDSKIYAINLGFHDDSSVIKDKSFPNSLIIDEDHKPDPDYCTGSIYGTLRNFPWSAKANEELKELEKDYKVEVVQLWGLNNYLSDNNDTPHFFHETADQFETKIEGNSSYFRWVGVPMRKTFSQGFGKNKDYVSYYRSMHLTCDESLRIAQEIKNYPSRDTISFPWVKSCVKVKGLNPKTNKIVTQEYCKENTLTFRTEDIEKD